MRIAVLVAVILVVVMVIVSGMKMADRAQKSLKLREDVALNL